MKEFINELKHNQDINYKKGLENRINIDYIIERLEDLEKSYNKYLKERLNFLNGAIDHFIDNDEETALKYMYCRSEIEAIRKLLEGGQHDKNN